MLVGILPGRRLLDKFPLVRSHQLCPAQRMGTAVSVNSFTVSNFSQYTRDKAAKSTDFAHLGPSDAKLLVSLSLPSQIALAKVTVVRGEAVDRMQQIQLFDNRCRSEIEVTHKLDCGLVVTRTECVHLDRNRLR